MEKTELLEYTGAKIDEFFTLELAVREYKSQLESDIQKWTDLQYQCKTAESLRVYHDCIKWNREKLKNLNGAVGKFCLEL